MRSGRLIPLLLLFQFVAACGGGSGGGEKPVPSLDSINVIPANLSLGVGTVRKFTAIGIYSDKTTGDVTEAATWTSSDQAVAPVNNSSGSKGMVTASTAGTAEISAALGNSSGSVTINVTAVEAPAPAEEPTSPGGGEPSAGGAPRLDDTGSQAVNLIPVTVNGGLCSVNSYPNKPCISITVCTPSTSDCQTIDDILLDTGSFGLRLFRQAVTLSLPPVTDANGSIGECVQFADGTSLWGPVMLASVQLGAEPQVVVPIQVIAAGFGSIPSTCDNATETPERAGFNGILGVGLFPHDCGSTCTGSANNNIYYSCSGSQCMGAPVPLERQVQNPVALLPQDNNGVMVTLPPIGPDGAPSASGALILGIGTRENNSPVGVTTFNANISGEIITIFNEVTYGSFIDSGSNGLFFSSSGLESLPICPSYSSSWYCPADTTGFSATTASFYGDNGTTVSFMIGNFSRLINSGNHAFNDIGGPFPGHSFDWGLPFFFGKNIFIGIQGKPSPLGTGPYWAF